MTVADVEQPVLSIATVLNKLDGILSIKEQ